VNNIVYNITKGAIYIIYPIYGRCCFSRNTTNS